MDTMGGRSSGLRYRLNNWTAGVVATLVLLTPVALGGNRPAIWALSAVFLFVWGSIYFGRLGFADVSLRATTRHFRLPTILFGLTAGYMVIQTLPLAGLLPSSWLALPGGVDPGRSVSIAPGDTGLALMRWLSYGLLFYLCLQISANSSRSRTFLTVLFWIVVAHAIYGLALFLEFGDSILFTDKWAYLGSATGGFVNRNSYATFLAIGLTIGTTLLANRLLSAATENRARRWINVFEGMSGAIYLMIGCLLLVVTLALTASRMGFFAALCGSLAALVLLAWQRGHRFGGRALVAIVVAGVAGLGLLVLLYGTFLFERLGSVESDANVRASLYWQIWSMIADRPLLGFGGSSFEYAYPLYHQAPVNFDLVWDKAHSTYLELWVSYGLVVGTFPMIILAWCLLRLFGLVRRDGKGDPAVLAAIGTIVGGAIHSIVDFSLEIQGVAYLFIAVVANGLGAMSRRVRQSERG